MGRLLKALGLMLKALGLVFLVLLVVVGGCLFWSYRTGAGLQQKFYAAVETGDSRQLLTLMAPELREKVDEPLLVTWIKAVNERLGRWQGMRRNGFHTSTEVDEGGTITGTMGTVDFERGSAHSKLTFRNGLLVTFSVESEQLGDEWRSRPNSNELYHERAKQFLTFLAQGDAPKASAMMHEELRKSMPLEKLKKDVARLREKSGVLKSLAWLKDEFEAKPAPHLKVYYRADFDKLDMDGMVDFGFIDFQGHIQGFELSPPDKSDSMDN
jgi:hypothetical protein